jgi:hypothetical protein
MNLPYNGVLITLVARYTKNLEVSTRCSIDGVDVLEML